MSGVEIFSVEVFGLFLSIFPYSFMKKARAVRNGLRNRHNNLTHTTTDRKLGSMKERDSSEKYRSVCNT